jgi:YVTN family beta-propeller protein
VNAPKSGTVRLQFDLGTAATAWGSARGDEPPSFDSGVRPPLSSTSVVNYVVANDPLTPAQLRSVPFIVTYFDGTLIPVDAQTNALGNAYSLGERVPDAVRVPGSTTVALASIYTNSVAFVDMESNSLQTRVKTGANPTALALSRDGSTLWVAERSADAVLPIDVHAMKAGSPVYVGVRPIALTMSPDGTMLFVANQGSNSVSVVDVRASKEVRRIATGSGPSALAIARDGTLYVADMFANEVVAIDPKNGATLARIPVGVFPRAIAVAGDRVYVANWANSTVSVIDAAARRVVQALRTGDQPAALAVSPDRQKIFVALSGDNAFQTIDVASGALSPMVFTPGSSPRTVRFSDEP